MKNILLLPAALLVILGQGCASSSSTAVPSPATAEPAPKAAPQPTAAATPDAATLCGQLADVGALFDAELAESYAGTHSGYQLEYITCKWKQGSRTRATMDIYIGSDAFAKWASNTTLNQITAIGREALEGDGAIYAKADNGWAFVIQTGHGDGISNETVSEMAARANTAVSTNY